jgi:hypothetical protein
VWDIFNASKDSVALPNRTNRPVLSKVDQLMALCDELEAGLAQAQTEGGKLMEAVVHHVLTGR